MTTQTKTGCLRLGAGLRAARLNRFRYFERGSLGITAYDLGIQRSRLSQWEGGYRSIPADVLKRLARYYRIEFRGLEYHTVKAVEYATATDRAGAFMVIATEGGRRIFPANDELIRIRRQLVQRFG